MGGFGIPYGYNQANISSQPFFICKNDILDIGALFSKLKNKTDHYQAFNDVYSADASDSSNWRRHTSLAPWSVRENFGVCALGSTILLMGGFAGSKFYLDGQGRYQYIGGNNTNDVWTTTTSGGVTWSLLTSNADWAARSEFGLVTVSNVIYLLAGRVGTGNGLVGTTLANDVWSSANGLNWTRASPLGGANFSPRCKIQVSVIRDSAIFVVGGLTNLTNNTASNDAWISTGKHGSRHGVCF